MALKESSVIAGGVGPGAPEYEHASAPRRVQPAISGTHFLYGFLPVAALTVILSVRIFRVLNKYAVNIFFWDEWDFRLPQFQGASLWRIFLWQHGPPRLGIGFVADTLLNRLTRWDSRGTSFLEGAVMLAAMLCALWLKQRLFGRLTLSDVVIPVIFLAPAQFLAFITTPIVAHGPFPALLTVLFCLAWTVRNIWWRNGLALLLNFLLIFTGFGTFVGFITPVLFAVELFQALRERGQWWIPTVSLAISVLSLGSFFIGYKVAPAAGCLDYARASWLHYIWFAGLIFANLFSLNGHSLLPSLLGIAVLALTCLTCGWCGYQFLRRKGAPPLQIIGITLTGASVLFTINAAVGRICLGMEAAHAARYVPYLLSGFLGIYFFTLTVQRDWPRRVLVALFTIVIIAGVTPFRKNEEAGLAAVQVRKQAWKNCYLKKENIDYCNSITAFRIYPFPAATNLQQKLDFLKVHRLNLYNGD